MSTQIQRDPKSRKRNKATKLNISQLSDRQLMVQEFFNGTVVGQPGLVGAAVRAYGRGVSVIRRPGRPIYVVFALGRRGTGKTFTPSMLAKFLHGDETALTKIKCGSYKEPHRVSQLLGAPPSYVGYKDPDDPKNRVAPDKIDKKALLSRHNLVASRKGSEVPISIVVFDEVEKAIEELEDVLLSIMWEGQADLGNNETTDFSDCIIWLTGNVGAHELEKLGKVIGFVQKEATQEDMEGTVEGVLTKRYKPEFLDRIDEIVIARKFDKEQMRQMVEVHVGAFRRRLDETLPRGKQFDLAVDGPACDFILKQAMKDTDSARGIVRAIEKLVEDPLGNELTKGTIGLGDLVEVTHEEGDTELSFYHYEGEGTVSEADKITIFGNRDSGVGLGLQRRTSVANSLAKKKEKQLYRIRITDESDTKLAQRSSTIMHEAKEIFGLKVMQSSFTQGTSPLRMDFIVKGIAEQIELFKEAFKDAAVTKVDGLDGEE